MRKVFGLVLVTLVAGSFIGYATTSKASAQVEQRAMTDEEKFLDAVEKVNAKFVGKLVVDVIPSERSAEIPAMIHDGAFREKFTYAIVPRIKHSIYPGPYQYQYFYTLKAVFGDKEYDFEYTGNQGYYIGDIDGLSVKVALDTSMIDKDMAGVLVLTRGVYAFASLSEATKIMSQLLLLE